MIAAEAPIAKVSRAIQFSFAFFADIISLMPFSRMSKCIRQDRFFTPACYYLRAFEEIIDPSNESGLLFIVVVQSHLIYSFVLCFLSRLTKHNLAIDSTVLP